MSQQDAAALVRYLTAQVAQGYTLLTWNGLGIDLDILAEEARMLPQCRTLALAHVDMMFHAFCQLGHGVGLDAAAKGMGLAGKLGASRVLTHPCCGRKGGGRKCCATSLRT